MRLLKAALASLVALVLGWFAFIGWMWTFAGVMQVVGPVRQASGGHGFASTFTLGDIVMLGSVSGLLTAGAAGVLWWGFAVRGRE